MSCQFNEKDTGFLNSGELYDCYDPAIVSFQNKLLVRLARFNDTVETEEGLKEREAILREIVGTYGEGLWIQPPVYSNWGLHHVHVGKNVYMNFCVTLVDDADIYIGDSTMIGPNVTISTAEHPLSPSLRKQGFQFNKPVHIGNNVWIGAGAIVLSGVTVGDNAVIGAGSVVTHDIEENSIVVGVPARMMRRVNEDDDRFYDGGKPIAEHILGRIAHN